MFRVLYVLLTSYALLACPYRCLGSLPPEGSSAESAQSCSCCGRQPDSAVSTDRHAPPAPVEPCQCNCLCQGAVLSKDDALLLTADSSWTGLVAAILPAGPITAPGGPAVAKWERRFGGAPASGRMLRFALQSLQI